MSSSNANQLSQPCIYERKSRFMKWLSKLFRSGAGNQWLGARGQQPRSVGDENMAWPAPARSLDDRPRGQKEKEELDRAIALSLSEDLKKPNGYRWRTDNDEDRARTHHDNFNSVLPPPNIPRDYHTQSYRTCGGCKRDIGYGNYLGCMGMFFHPACFCCHACGNPITEYEFSLLGSDAYHKVCLKELTHPKCGVCYQFIPTNGDGLIEYRCHPFWLQKYCPSHEHDNTARCCSCERLESRNTRLLTGAILAHELMHGWLCLNDYRKEPETGGRRRHLSGALPNVARIRGHPGVQERAIHICSRVVVIVINMVLWFKHPIIAVFFFRIPLAAASNIQERLEVECKLGEFFMHQITHDASPAYGGGFRSAMAVVNKYGLRRNLDNIQYTGTFPE